jgi:hypothetical protein
VRTVKSSKENTVAECARRGERHHRHTLRGMVEPSLARKTWRTLEPYHGLVYFAPEPAARYAALGIDGFDGYFASRAAAFGAASAELVIATFFNFRPSVVHHALPGAWQAASPGQLIDARRAGVGEALARTTGSVLDGDALARAAAMIRPAAEAVGDHLAGRPLAAAHLALRWPEDPRLVLWHAVTILREHRGDGHIACLCESGVEPCEALVLHAASGDVTRAALQATRQWTDDEWAAAVDRLAARGLVDADGSFTEAGRCFRDRIETRTDELAAPPWSAIGPEACEELRALVRPASRAIVDGGSFGLR